MSSMLSIASLAGFKTPLIASSTCLRNAASSPIASVTVVNADSAAPTSAGNAVC